jgi:hypothetical protein
VRAEGSSPNTTMQPSIGAQLFRAIETKKLAPLAADRKGR